MSSNNIDQLWKAIDSSQYLFLGRLFEPSDNALTVILEEALANKEKTTPNTKIGDIELPGESCPIEPTSSCSVFLLNWKNYVSYAVTEEMHGSCGNYEDEKYSGRLLRVYTKSHFLDFVAKDTGAHFDSYQHYKIACQNHIIDIVSASNPELASFSRFEAQGRGLIF